MCSASRRHGGRCIGRRLGARHPVARVQYDEPDQERKRRNKWGDLHKKMANYRDSDHLNPGNPLLVCERKFSLATLIEAERVPNPKCMCVMIWVGSGNM